MYQHRPVHWLEELEIHQVLPPLQRREQMAHQAKQVHRLLSVAEAEAEAALHPPLPRVIFITVVMQVLLPLQVQRFTMPEVEQVV
jgi:hypothetical protein